MTNYPSAPKMPTATPVQTNNNTKMPRKNTKTETPVAAAPAAAEPVARKAKRTRTEAPPAVEPVAAATEAASPAVELTLDEHIGKLKTLYKAVGEAIKDAYRVMKSHHKQLKQASASQKRARRQRDPNAPPPKPSGITKKQAVSAELLAFFNKPAGTQLSRTDVSSLIFEYVRSKNLVSADKKSNWIPDAPLQKLLRLTPDDVLTMARIQKVIGVHFPAKAATATA